MLHDEFVHFSKIAAVSWLISFDDSKLVWISLKLCINALLILSELGLFGHKVMLELNINWCHGWCEFFDLVGILKYILIFKNNLIRELDEFFRLTFRKFRRHVFDGKELSQVLLILVVGFQNPGQHFFSLLLGHVSLMSVHQDIDVFLFQIDELGWQVVQLIVIIFNSSFVHFNLLVSSSNVSDQRFDYFLEFLWLIYLSLFLFL